MFCDIRLGDACVCAAEVLKRCDWLRDDEMGAETLSIGAVSEARREVALRGSHRRKTCMKLVSDESHESENDAERIWEKMKGMGGRNEMKGVVG
jgi:hypothetical protein